MMRLLLVEDSLLLQERVLEALHDLLPVAHVDTAQTQNAALELLAQHRYDLVIADIELAQGNGLEVIRRARQLYEQSGDAPVFVILSNHAHYQYRKLASNLGVRHFFDKSMQFDEAIQVVSQLAQLHSN